MNLRRKEIEVLEDRARRMLAAAEEHLSKGDYDLSCFMAEQVSQLYVKAKILEKTGEMPRTHLIRQLLGLLKTLGAEDAEKFVKNNRELLLKMEDAYLQTRYLPKLYEKEDAEILLALAKEVFKLAERV